MDSVPTELESSSMAFNNSAMERRGPRRRKKKKSRTISPRCKGRNSNKTQSASTFLTFLDNMTEYTTSRDNSESELSDRVHWKRNRIICDGDGFQDMHTMNACIQRAVDYWGDRLNKKILKYDHTIFKNITKMSKYMVAQIEDHMLFTFLIQSQDWNFCSFKLSCNIREMHEGTAI